MSYEIIYDKQFLKVEDKGIEKYCPIILTGSNNCTDLNGRRSRNWWNWTFFTDNKSGFETLETMLKNVEKYKEEIVERNKAWGYDYNDDSFGCHTGTYINGSRTTSYGQFKGIFITGAKKAVTVEQIRQFASVYVETSEYDNKTLEKFGKKRIFISVATSEQLVEEYYKAVEYLQSTGISPQITISASENVGKNIRERFFKQTAKAKERKEVDHYFVIKDFSLDNYVVKSKRNGYSFSRYGKDYAKKFHTERQAKAYAKRLDKKYNKEGRFIVEPVEEKTVVYI